VLVLAIVMLAVLAFAGWAVWHVARRPVAAPQYQAPPQPRQIATVETDGGRVIQIEQAPQETSAQFQLRLYLLAAQAAQQEQALLEAPKR
jgi:hypothetical protein